MDKRQKVRIPAAIQLIQGEDDDLIQWLRGLDKGERQPAIKRLLRLALGMKERPKKSAPVAQLDEAIVKRIADLEKQNREQDEYTQRVVTWAEGEISRLRAELAQRPTTNGNDIAPMPKDDGRLSNEKLARRADRVDKSAW